MSYQHKDLAAGRWQKMPLIEQMANIGSEVQRALKWRSKGNQEYFRQAFERALELIDLTLESGKDYPRLKEITRMREAIVDYFAGQNEFKSSEGSWQRYFLPFAYAARKKPLR